jgi:hypothetical protein
MRLTVEYLEDCRKRGLSCSEVALEAGCTISGVYGFCKRNKIYLTKSQAAGGGNSLDIAGQEFGKLKVLRRVGSKRKLSTWECQCPCGKLFVAFGTDIVHRKTKTCGCRINIESRRNWQGYGEIPKSYWQVLNGNARQKQRDLDVTIEYLNDLFISQNRRCALSGLEISFKKTERHKTASLDRIDNNKGYVVGNVQWVHKDINNMKHTFGNDYFLNLCLKIADWQRGIDTKET